MKRPSHDIKTIFLLLFTAICNGAIAQGIQNNGNLYISPSGNMGILGTYGFTNTSVASYLNDGNLYIYGDFTNNQAGMASGSGTGNGEGTIWFQGSNTQALNGTNPFFFYNLQLNKTAATNLVNMSQNVTVHNNLTLTKGIVTTGTSLFTWDQAGTLTAPNVPWTAHAANYGDSYIATCDAAGTPISVAGPTSPFAGTSGFKIKNISSASGDVYFPVGASYLPAGSSFSPTPNRMMLHNTSATADDFTVVVNPGDITGTPNPRVNRIWYVNSALSTDKVTMRLFFTERDPSHFLDGTAASQNEVEAGFSYVNDIYLVEKDYAGNPNFIAEAGSTDIQSFPSGTYPYGEEVYGQYSVGISPDAVGNKNGITQFNRFSIINNSGGIILSLSTTNLRAYHLGSLINLSWTSLHEENIARYEIEKSTNGTDFSEIGQVAALNNGNPLVSYLFKDTHPVSGNNFYRIKIIDQNAGVSYTSVVVVAIQSGKPSLYLFPNPVIRDNFTLQMNNLPAGNYQLRIFNTLGQVLLAIPISHPGGSASQVISLPPGVSKGTYELLLSNGSSRMNSSFLVL